MPWVSLGHMKFDSPKLLVTMTPLDRLWLRTIESSCARTTSCTSLLSPAYVTQFLVTHSELQDFLIMIYYDMFATTLWALVCHVHLQSTKQFAPLPFGKCSVNVKAGMLYSLMNN